MNACGDSRLRGLRSRKPIGFRQWVVHVAKDIKQDLSIFAYKWLETAEARSLLDWKKMNSVLPEANGILKAVHENDKKKVLFEYTLILDLKVKR